MVAFTITQLLAASLAVGLVIMVPINGVLVRLRAQYNPKGLRLHPEHGVQPHTGPVITSFFALLVRVYRIEGWLGLYKGFMPTLLSSPVVFASLWFAQSNSNLRRWVYTTSLTGALGILAYDLSFILISLPRIIITVRATTTPHKLPYFNAVYALRVLLTPTEYRRPWILYLTPGILAAQVSYRAYVDLGLTTVRHLLLGEPTPSGQYFRNGISVTRLAMFFVVALASTAILAPLHVITIRLAIQRNHAAHEFNSVSQEEEGDTEGTLGYSGMDEDVIGLRTEQEPYTGVVDCAKRIVVEEGWRALYRGWWWTMLSCLAGYT